MSDAPLLNASEIGKQTGLSTQTVMRFYKAGKIPAEVAEGRVFRFDPLRVRQALAARAALVSPKPPTP